MVSSAAASGASGAAAASDFARVTVPTARMHERLKTIIGNQRYATVAGYASLSEATVRRYMIGHAPSLEFLVAVYLWQGVSPDFLLMGRVPLKPADYPEHLLVTFPAMPLWVEKGRRIDGCPRVPGATVGKHTSGESS